MQVYILYKSKHIIKNTQCMLEMSEICFACYTVCQQSVGRNVLQREPYISSRHDAFLGAQASFSHVLPLKSKRSAVTEVLCLTWTCCL